MNIYKQLQKYSSFSFLFATLTLLSILLFFSQQGNAQSHYVSGYVVLRSGDTIRGFINDKEWRVNPQSVEFKESVTAKETVYTPGKISSFRITDGDWYRSYIGPLEKTPNQTASLDHRATLDTLHDSLFVRALVVGPASLYYSFDDLHGDHFFIQKNGEAINELFYKKYLKQGSNGDIMLTNEGYKSQIVSAFNDCSDIQNSFTTIPLTYSKKDLENIFQRYNKCKQPKAAVYVADEKGNQWKFEPIVLAGINYSSLKFKGSFNYSDVTFENKLGYAFGVALNSVIPKNRGIFSIYTELLLKNYNSTGTGFSGAVTPEAHDLVLNLTYLKVNVMARFQKPSGEVRPFCQIGISNGFALRAENYINKSGDKREFMDVRTYEQGLVLGVGARMKKIQLEGRAEFSNGISSYSSLSTPFTTLYALLSYSFN